MRFAVVSRKTWSRAWPRRSKPKTPRSRWPRRSETDGLQLHPVFCLMRASVSESLVAFTHAGQRKIDRWTAQHRTAQVVFDDARAFVNANTLAELQQLGA